MTFLKLLFKRVFFSNRSNNIRFLNFIINKLKGTCNFPYSVHFSTTFSSPENIKIAGGKNLIKSLSNSGNCYFSAHNGIEFGYNVLFAPNVQIISSNHDFSENREPLTANPVVICNDAWIGTNVVILPEVTIGEKAVIGAGSVVSKSVPPYCIVVGNPIRIVGWICNCGDKLINVNDNWCCSSCHAKYTINDNQRIKIE